jgi:CDP-diglyceride synthetase
LNVAEEQDQSQIPGQQQQERGKEGLSKTAREQAISPHQSVWPFALALALMVLLMGFITQPVILGVGVVLVIAAVIGWGFERR